MSFALCLVQRHALPATPICLRHPQLATNASRRLEDRRRSFGPLDWLAFFVPFAGWIRTYDRAWLQSDVLAGLSVACMEIPQVGGQSWGGRVGRSGVMQCMAAGAARCLRVCGPRSAAHPCALTCPPRAGYVVRFAGRPAALRWPVRSPGALLSLHALLHLQAAGEVVLLGTVLCRPGVASECTS